MITICDYARRRHGQTSEGRDFKHNGKEPWIAFDESGRPITRSRLTKLAKDGHADAILPGGSVVELLDALNGSFGGDDRRDLRRMTYIAVGAQNQAHRNKVCALGDGCLVPTEIRGVEIITSTPFATTGTMLGTKCPECRRRMFPALDDLVHRFAGTQPPTPVTPAPPPEPTEADLKAARMDQIRSAIDAALFGTMSRPARSAAIIQAVIEIVREERAEASSA